MLKHNPKYYADKYKHHYMTMACSAAQNSQAEKRKVGCIIYLNNHTLVEGWNGMPSGESVEVCEDDKGVTLPNVLHAENNAIIKVLESGGHKLLEDSVLFVTYEPCLICSDIIIDNNIQTVYYQDSKRSSHLGLENLLINNVEVIRL